MTLYREREHTARKSYRCDECAAAITAGVRYVAWFQLVDGVSWSGHICKRCNDLWREAWLADLWFDQEDGPSLGSLRDWLLVEQGIADPDGWGDQRRMERGVAHFVAQVGQNGAALYLSGPA